MLKLKVFICSLFVVFIMLLLVRAFAFAIQIIFNADLDVALSFGFICLAISLCFSWAIYFDIKDSKDEL